MGNDEMENKIIKTQDENGEIYSFELIDVVEFNGREYGLLIHVEEDAKDSSDEENDEDMDEEEAEEEVVIMRLNKEADDSYVFETIEDDEEFNALIDYLESEEEDDED